MAGTKSELASRRTTLAFIRTLLGKNWVLKKRHPFVTFFEICLPVAFIVLMGALKQLTTDVQVPAGFSTDTSIPTNDEIGTSYNLFATNQTQPIGWLPDGQMPLFYQTETSIPGLLLFMNLQSYSNGIRLNELSKEDRATCQRGILTQGLVSTDKDSPYRVPDECGGRVSPYKIGIAPDNAFTRNYFLKTMDEWYPRITLFNSSGMDLTLPSLADSVTFFDSNEAFEDYVSGDGYGDGLESPKIYAGIVFDTIPDDNQIGSFSDIEYSLRFNSTPGGQGSSGMVPGTSGSRLFKFQKLLNTDYYTRYAMTGFMTLQTLVSRFVNCMPEWDATNKSTTGECQQTESTATSSPEVDAALMDYLRNDVVVSTTLDMLLSQTGMDVPDMSTLISLLPNTTSERFFRPLRQAPQPYLGATTAPFPIDEYMSSEFFDSIANVFALVFMLSYLFLASRILVVFILEKETRMREFMKIVGVRERAIVMSWFITYIIVIFIASVLQALGGQAGLFVNSNMFLIFLFFFLFGLTVLAYGYLISTIFSKSRTGTYIGMVVFFIMYFVSAAITPETNEGTRIGVSILSPVALAQGANTIADLESTGQGLNFESMTSLNENFRFVSALYMFVLDAVLYTLIGLYFERVIPKDYGVTLKWYFPVSPSYWRSRRIESSDKSGQMNAALLYAEVNEVPNDSFEPVPTELKEQARGGDALSVKDLRKVFSVPGGEKVAVKGMELVMYKNQITCLLGHNGAGKTTLISMLTGMTAPTSGDAYFNGLTLTRDMDEIRQSLGLCFQHDVLYPDLTVREHLRFFGKVKGYREEELDAIIEEQIKEVGLTEKVNVLSTELSGGMKRKLSVAISLLGDSTLVFLDEPTSGMDPYSRRSTWEILLNNRNDRVMVLTTHFMDEADILGDRIAIMSEGELRCCGSSLFLKNRFGAGYNLTLVKDDNCDDNGVITFIKKSVPEATLLSNVGAEIAFQLPLNTSHKFADMFAELDDSLRTLGLWTYGVSVTTLEEVFIKVAEVHDEEGQHTLQNDAYKGIDANTGNEFSGAVLDEAAFIKREGRAMFFTHLGALLRKRFHNARRDRKMLIYSTLLPVVLMVAGLGLLNGTALTQNDPSLPLTTNDYEVETGKDFPTPYYCQVAGEEQDWCDQVMKNYFSEVKPQAIDNVPTPAYDSDEPTVFGVKYTDPSINASGTSGYELRVAESIYKRGYGKDGETVVEGQYGGFFVYRDESEKILSYNSFTNTSAKHGSVIFKALMDEAIYRFFSDDDSVTLKVNSHPLPLSSSTKALFGSFLAFSACLFICIAFAYFPAGIVVFLVKEKEASHNSKHQQLVSGVSLGAFWLANFIWDLIMYVIPFVAAIVLVQIFDIAALTGSAQCTSCTSMTYPAVIILFVLFGLAIIPFTYCLSYLFSESASSQTYTIMINFLFGTILLVVSFILDQVEGTQDANAALVFIWRLSPLFNLGNGLMQTVMHELVAIIDTDKVGTSPFSADIMGYEVLFLVINIVLYSTLAVGIDYAMTFPKIKHWMSGRGDVEDETYDIDEDVRKEAEKVSSGRADDDMIVLKGIRKVYKGGKSAVRNLTFSLKKGECFGFLGINGAGKTSTMKMLTGDVLPTHGNATLGGFDIMTQQIEIRRLIGYCPQFDALFDLMTVKEHLELFAQIKGVPSANLNTVVQNKIKQLNLEAFADKLAGSLSGGNKRKLSVAIAMIGDPQIIFLDEPSTGMDPVSRRFMWDVITGISTRSKSATIVLTTHSMEECEALCSRVGIMVGGRLRCLGSVQHLKSRFGDGLMVDIKMAGTTGGDLDHIDDVQRSATITKDEIRDKCSHFGHEEYADRLTSTHATGYNLAAALERDGYVRARAFYSWCIEETHFDTLLTYLENEFGKDGVIVMERQNDFCRFKLKDMRHNELKLSKAFACVEDVKTQMNIKEYSVSQTTLEQIFNSFASQQEEEQGVARGVYNK